MKFGEKRAQVTTFMVVAMLILVLGGLLIYSGQTGTKKSKEVVSEQAALSAAASSVNAFANACLKQEADKAIGRNGYTKPFAEIGIRNDIVAGMPECTKGFESFAAQGITVSAGTPGAVVSIQPTVVAVTLTYPLTITESGKRSSVSKFSYTYNRDKSLKLGSSGLVAKTSVLTSQDKKAELLFAQGILITDYNGNPVETYSVGELDREDLPFPENVVSARAYELTPAEFSGPVKVTLAYPEGYENPEELYVAWWDEENQIWHGVPTTRDMGRKTLTAQLGHASDVAAVKCGAKDKTEPLGIGSLIFEQRCGKTRGEAVPGGSQISGSCVDTITTANLWIKDKNGLYLTTSGLGLTVIDKTVADVQPNEEYPGGQLSSPCAIKDWDEDDKSNEDINGCAANIDDTVMKVEFSGKTKEELNVMCVEACKKSVKSAYGELNGNLQTAVPPGDGLKDGEKCGCTNKGNSVECTTNSPATPPVAGYESGISGGYGVLSFYMNPGSCYVDVDGQGTPDMVVYASDQDEIKNLNNYKKSYSINDKYRFAGSSADERTIKPQHFTINPVQDKELTPDTDAPIDETNFGSFLSKVVKDANGVDTSIGLTKKGGLRKGLNKIYFKVDELKAQVKQTGCAHLWVNARIQGVGISGRPEVAGETWESCTVQQRINFIQQAKLTPDGQAELEALKQFKGGADYEETLEGGKKLTEVPDYQAKYLGKNTGAAIGCGGDTSTTSMVSRLKRKCSQNRLAYEVSFCDDEQPSIVYACNGRTLSGYEDCNDKIKGTVCNKGLKLLTNVGFSTDSTCVSPESSGCSMGYAYPACVEEGKPEMFTCINGKRESKTCATGKNCYVTGRTASIGGTACAENACTKKTPLYYCNGKKYYKCDGQGAIEETGECGAGEECVDSAQDKKSVCVSTAPSCSNKRVYDQINVSTSGGTSRVKKEPLMYCSDKGYSGEMYNCDAEENGIRVPTVIGCPLGTVCLKDGVVLDDDPCGKSGALDMLCSGRPDGYNCESKGVSGTLIKCKVAKFDGERLVDFCDAYGTKCSVYGVPNPEDACKQGAAAPTLAPKAEWGMFKCIEAGKTKITYTSSDGKVTDPSECGGEKVCVESNILSSNKETICAEKQDYYCTDKEFKVKDSSGKDVTLKGLNRPVSKIFCKDKGKDSGYYFCGQDPNRGKYFDDTGACSGSKMCLNEGVDDKDSACSYAPSSDCPTNSEGSFFCEDNARMTVGRYKCALQAGAGKVLYRVNQQCSKYCCGPTKTSGAASANAKCDSDCDVNCYGKEENGLGDDKWYATGDFKCTKDTVSNKVIKAHKCAGGSQGWSSWLCDLSKDEYCVESKGDCVQACTGQKLNDIPAVRTKYPTGLLSPDSLYFLGDTKCVEKVNYKCGPTSKGFTWVDSGSC